MTKKNQGEAEPQGTARKPTTGLPLPPGTATCRLPFGKP
jgi:hypothetical protein